MNNYKNSIDPEKLPEHIAIIMDGNGRWASERFGRTRIFGHINGVKAVRNITETCAKLGVKYLTLYAFSTENWGRPQEEVSGLMSLLIDTLKKEINQLHKNQIRVNTIGDIAAMPLDCYTELVNAKNLTQNNHRLTLTLALNYSGRWELTQAMKNIANDVKNNTLNLNDVNSETVSKYLNTYNIPDPELLIRTSGEYRISNFLLWQIAYTELYFTDTFWPDFSDQDLYKAIADYQQRHRRFGKL